MSCTNKDSNSKNNEPSARTRQISDRNQEEIVKQQLTAHLADIRRFALSLTKNAANADDLTHDTIVKALRNHAQFEAGSNFKHWIFRIMKNTFIDDIRKKSRQGTSIEFDAVTMGEAILEPQLKSLELGDFRAAFNTLSKSEQTLLLWVGCDGIAYQDIAARINIPVGTVKSKVNRARTKLKELYSV